MNVKMIRPKNETEDLSLVSRQETVLAGVAEHLTEEERSNINVTLSKKDQLSNNIKVEEHTPSHQNTRETKFCGFLHIIQKRHSCI